MEKNENLKVTGSEIAESVASIASQTLPLSPETLARLEMISHLAYLIQLDPDNGQSVREHSAMLILELEIINRIAKEKLLSDHTTNGQRD